MTQDQTLVSWGTVLCVTHLTTTTTACYPTASLGSEYDKFENE